MGFRDRDYSRGDDNESHWGVTVTPAVKYILIANVVVFLLQIFVVREVQSATELLRRFNPEFNKLYEEAEAGNAEAAQELKKQYGDILESDKDKSKLRGFASFMPRVSIVTEWFELVPSKVYRQGQVWRLFTHAFCHSRESLWHILFNMLAFFWFGRTLESMFGTREFTYFYFAGILAAAFAYIALDLYTGENAPAIGASGAVMAVLMLYTWHFPRSEMLVFWVLPIEMRFLMAFYVLWDLHPVLLTLSGDRGSSGIAHAAHLGGLAFGFFYGKCNWNISSLVGDVFDRRSWPLWLRRSPLRSRPRLRIAPEPRDDEGTSLDADNIDAILQKIFVSGRASLTDAEIEILRKASERLKKQRRD